MANFLTALVTAVLLTRVQCSPHRGGPRLADQWAVGLREEGASLRELEQRAQSIASQHGLVYKGPVSDITRRRMILDRAAVNQVPGVRGMFQFSAPKSAAENNSSALTRSLQQNEEVEVAEQQRLLVRELRRSHVLEKKPLDVMSATPEGEGGRFRERRGSRIAHFKWPTDPLWSRQWTLYNVGQSGGKSGLDIKVLPAWIQGYTGKGVVVSIVDDGLLMNHPDLISNIDWSASLNTVDGSNDPSPSSSYDNHGTKCAGVVAMEKSNHYCGVGVAHHVTLTGISFDLSQVTDLLESTMLSYRSDYISVYSCSWGPSDSGFTVAGPEQYARTVLQQGASQGRGGLGNIYTFASGNGGSNGDSCAADGYVNSIYTLAVGSADHSGRQAFYDEDCAAKIAVTYSFNSKTFDDIYAYEQLSTTSIDGECTDSFTGTSASAPLMAAVVALVLEANSRLSWRDVQYLVVYTSNHSPLKSGSWKTNGAGLKFSHKFGFGAVDAEAMVTRARNWISVPEQQSCTIYPGSSGTAYVGSPLSVSFSVDSSSCTDVGFLEHVVVAATLSMDVEGYQSYYEEDYYQDPSVVAQTGPRRGDIAIRLTSPSGTTSTLLPQRPADFVNAEGYYEWPFMSRHFWGESPRGTWTLYLSYDSSAGSVSLDEVAVILYGTTSVPKAVERIPSKCSSQCARGCAAKGEAYCDSCRDFRLPSTLRCVITCPTGQCGVSGYCVHCSPYRLSALAITGIAAGAIALVGLSAALLLFIWSRRWWSCRHSNYDTL